MRDHERAMLAYVKLAETSQAKRQLQGCDKFLILAGAAACRAGWPEIADRCRMLVLANNPAHLVGRFELFTDAMRSCDFAPFLKQLERFCGYERAEHLLNQLEIDVELPSTKSVKSIGEFALELLSGDEWIA